MKQRRHLSNKITAVFAASIMSIALTGITCGSFAWFTYMTRAKIEEFQGVTIGFGELEAGILSDVDLPDADNYGLVKDESYPGQTIYWFDGHTMQPETLGYVLSMNGYATNELFPVTTRKYSKGDSFKLFSTPTMEATVDDYAAKLGRIYLPLVFRYADILEDGTYIGDEEIFLSQIKLNTTQSNSHIHESIRVFTDNKNGDTHLINPSSTNDGATDVGGVLDLNGDGFYDIDLVGGELFEHIYGQVKQESTIYKALPESDDTIIYPDQRTTFNAGHQAGVYAVESYDPEIAEYEGMYGFRNKRKSVTTTNPHTNNLAYLDLSIFAEGWDLSVVDSEIGILFSMELNFEVTI